MSNAPHTYAVACLSALLLLSTCGIALAQSVSMQVTSRAIAKDDTLTLEIRLSGDLDEYEEPNLKDWRVIKSGSSNKTQIINGRIRRERVFTKELEPRKTGKLLIGSLRGFKDGAEVASAPAIPIEVRKVAELPSSTVQAATDLQRRIGQDLFVIPHVSKAAPYEGEPFVMTFYLYFRSARRLSSERVEMPKLEGFLSENLIGDDNPRTRVRLGRYRYERITLKQNLVIALKAGEQRIGSLRMTLLGGDMFNQTRRKVSTQPFLLPVRPVPDGVTRPETYREGNLGVFSIHAAFDQTNATVGERRMLTVTVKGTGNLTSVKAPKLNETSKYDVELLDGQDAEMVEKDAKGMQGEVSFLYVVTPKEAGAITLPPIRLDAFDPNQGRFYSASSLNLSLEVAPAPNDLSLSQEEGLSIKPVASTLEPGKKQESTAVPPTWLWLVLGGPLFLVVSHEFSLLLAKKRTAGASDRQRKEALSKAKRALRGLEKGESNTTFVESVHQVVSVFLEERFGVSMTGLTRDGLRNALETAGAPDGAVDPLLKLVEEMDFARYAPGEGTESLHEKLLSEIQSTLKGLNEGGQNG